MNPASVRRTCLFSFIGFISLTALIAIVSVLASEFGEVQLKVLGTTFSISAASICAMACAALMEKRGVRTFSLIGVGTSIAAALLIITGIWTELDSEFYWKLTFSLTTFSIGLAYAFLLWLPALDSAHRWVQTASSISIGVLTIQIIAAVWGEIDNEGFYRLMAVISIVTVLFSLIVPVFMRLRHETHAEDTTLVLRKNADGTYSDKKGATYTVQPVEGSVDGKPPTP